MTCLKWSLIFLLIGCTDGLANGPGQFLTTVTSKVKHHRIRRGIQMGNLGAMCTNNAVCQTGNGGINAICFPIDDNLSVCSCPTAALPPILMGSQLCLQSCTTNANCPAGQICVNGRCLICAPLRCNQDGNCPVPKICNRMTNLCELPCLPPVTTPAPTTTTPATPPSIPVPSPPGAYCTQVCPDEKFAECRNLRCECIDGASRVNGTCVEDGAVGGRCDGPSRTMCSKDKNAIPANIGGICICACRVGTFLLEGSCLTDGTAGGRCDGNNDKCTRDKNAECRNNRCICSGGSSKVETMCITNGYVGGQCISNGFCVDRNSVCQGTGPTSMCMCQPGTTRINAACIQDGTPGGKCDGLGGNICSKDVNSQCINGMCMCNANTVLVNGVCVVAGVPVGRCFNVSCTDPQSRCVEGTCVCVNGTVEVEGHCKKPGSDGGYCVNGLCDSSLATCNRNRNICECKPGAMAIDCTCYSTALLQWLRALVTLRPQVEPAVVLKQQLSYDTYYDRYHHR